MRGNDVLLSTLSLFNTSARAHKSKRVSRYMKTKDVLLY